MKKTSAKKIVVKGKSKQQPTPRPCTHSWW